MSSNGAIIYQKSHDLVLFRSGHPLDTDVKGPMRFALDEEAHGELPTLFTTPGLVTTRKFLADLQELGIGNVQVYPTVIRDPASGETIKDYVFINVIGLISCADTTRSKFRRLGPKTTIVDELVLDSRKIPELDLFRLAEDRSILVISQRVHDHLRSQGYPDLFLEELPQS